MSGQGIVRPSLTFLLLVCAGQCTGQKAVCYGDTEDACPSGCLCTKSASKWYNDVDCLGKNVTSVPAHLPAHTTTLDLSYNRIRTIGPHALQGCHELTILKLNNNILYSIHAMAFQNLSQLSSLYLNHNTLRMTMDSLPRGLFDDQRELRFLSLDHNVPGTTEEYRGDLVEKLDKLSHLCLDGLPNGVALGVEFSRLHNLNILSISGHLTHIKNSTFRHMIKLPIDKVEIIDSKLRDVEPIAFGNFKMMTKLRLYINPFVGLQNLSRSWYGLQFTQIRYLAIIECSSFSSIEPFKMTETFFKGFENTNITFLALKGNNLGLLQTYFWKYLPFLQRLQIYDYNLLGGYWSMVTDIPKLRHLYSLEILSSAWDPSKVFLYPILHKKTITSEPLTENSSPHVLHDGYAKPSPQAYVTSLKKEPPFIFQLPPNLHSFRLTFPLSEINGGGLKIIGENRLRYVDLSSCHLNFLAKPIIIQAPNTTEGLVLDLSDNTLIHLDGSILKESIKKGLDLKELSLDRNDLAESLAQQSEGEMFKYYDKLVHLSLANNKIETLQPNSFQHLTNLRSLTLANNYLRSTTFKIDHLKKLNHLDLSSNSFSFLCRNTTTAIDRVALGRSFNISLSGNPFVCSCRTLDFLRWVADSHLIDDKGGCKCEYEGDFMNFTAITREFITTLELHCISRSYIKWSVIAFSSVGVILVIAIILFRQRWDLKFMCLKLMRHRRLMLEIEDQDLYYYDAFVAYHSDDISWIREHLLPNIEDTSESDQCKSPGFALCVHQRDFMPGTRIIENIIDSVNKSKKTILVLTKNFVSSSWCDFELQMARMRCFDKGRDIIIVIMLEDVPASAMTSTLRTLIRHTTYLEWPVDVQGRKAFWQKLRESLVRHDNRSLVCECGKTVYKYPREEKI